MTDFVPHRGSVRRFTCRACGEVSTDAYFGPGPLDYVSTGPYGEDFSRGCSQHPTHPGPRGPHDLAIEVIS